VPQKNGLEIRTLWLIAPRNHAGICLNLGKVDIRNPLCCLFDSAKK